jgi:hypothetical protein
MHVKDVTLELNGSQKAVNSSNINFSVHYPQFTQENHHNIPIFNTFNHHIAQNVSANLNEMFQTITEQSIENVFSSMNLARNGEYNVLVTYDVFQTKTTYSVLLKYSTYLNGADATTTYQTLNYNIPANHMITASSFSSKEKRMIEKKVIQTLSAKKPYSKEMVESIFKNEKSRNAFFNTFTISNGQITFYVELIHVYGYETVQIPLSRLSEKFQ